MRGAERFLATLQHVTQLWGRTQLAVAVVAATLACVACGDSPTGPTAPVAPGTASVGLAEDGGSAVAANNGQQNLTPADFQARGWECRNSPVPGRVVCSQPNQGFPLVPPPAVSANHIHPEGVGGRWLLPGHPGVMHVGGGTDPSAPGRLQRPTVRVYWPGVHLATGDSLLNACTQPVPDRCDDSVGGARAMSVYQWSHNLTSIS